MLNDQFYNLEFASYMIAHFLIPLKTIFYWHNNSYNKSHKLIKKNFQQYLIRAVFKWLSKIITQLHLLHLVTGLKMSR